MTNYHTLAAQALRQAARLYASGALKPGKHEYYREDHQYQTLAACPVGAIMIALEARNLTKARTLLDQLDSEEIFNELQSQLSPGKLLAHDTAQTALANTEPYKDHPLAIEAKNRDTMVNPAVIINDELLPDGEARAPAVLQWLNDAARQLETQQP